MVGVAPFIGFSQRDHSILLFDFPPLFRQGFFQARSDDGLARASIKANNSGPLVQLF
jgi:hypothetical protein